MFLHLLMKVVRLDENMYKCVSADQVISVKQLKLKFKTEHVQQTLLVLCELNKERSSIKLGRINTLELIQTVFLHYHYTGHFPLFELYLTYK
jgi:hypothetical protein